MSIIPGSQNPAEQFLPPWIQTLPDDPHAAEIAFYLHFPDFFRYPLAVVRKYGKHSRTLARMWRGLRELRRNRTTVAGLDFIAKHTGFPLPTLKRQLRKLKAMGAVALGRRYRKTTVTLALEVWRDFRSRTGWLRVPREWDTPRRFYPALIRAYVYFRCGAWDGRYSHLIETQDAIAETLGISSRSVRPVFEQLIAGGRLIRQKCPDNTHAYYVAGCRPPYPLRDVLSGKRKTWSDTPPVENENREEKTTGEGVAEFIRHFEQGYVEKFKQHFRIGSNRSAREKMKAAFRLFESLAEAKQFLDFVFDKWDELQRAFKLNGRPTPTLLGQDWFFGIVQESMHTGRICGRRRGNAVSNRAESPERYTDGWGDY